MRRIAIISLSLFLLALISCSTAPAVQKGQKFEVLEELKEKAEIRGIEGYAEGFDLRIPKGAQIETLFSSTSANVIECTVSSLDGNTDREYIIGKLVPEFVQNKEGFEDFSFGIKMDYIGKKIKKL